jgi:hypothetical protein
MHNSGATRGESAQVCLAVIASAAKQSTLAFLSPHGLLRRFAPRNDGLYFLIAPDAYAHTRGTIDLRGGLPLLGPRHR